MLYGSIWHLLFCLKGGSFPDEISMIPFGLLSGFMDSKEIRITELGEDGFRFRLAEECPESEQFLIYFYDMKKAGYRRVEIRKFGMSAAEDQCLQDQQPVE